MFGRSWVNQQNIFSLGRAFVQFRGNEFVFAMAVDATRLKRSAGAAVRSI